MMIERLLHYNKVGQATVDLVICDRARVNMMHITFASGGQSQGLVVHDTTAGYQ